MSERINLNKAAPKLYEHVSALDKELKVLIENAGIDEGFSHLLRLRASQINKCAFCTRLHTKDAIESGVDIDRISVLPAWRETDYFDSKEKASLAILEAITMITDGQVPDKVYEQAQSQLSERDIAAIEWLSIVINTWNRIAITSRYKVG